MKNNILSKEEFVNVIEDLRKSREFEDKVWSLFNSYDLEAPGFPDAYGMVVDTLNRMFELEISDYFGSDIDFFCLEINFGRDYTPGCIKDENGNEIDLSSADKLYDHVFNSYQKKLDQRYQELKERLSNRSKESK